jgi:tRNA(Ile)-lysidine synthase TilS/MesJ
MYKEAERSIIKKYRKTIWRNFVKACQDYQMIEENDRICVCISGGKDSVLLAKCLQELQKYSKVKFELEFMVMDPGYNPENRQLIIDNCEKLRIPIKIVDSDIFSIVENIDDNT